MKSVMLADILDNTQLKTVAKIWNAPGERADKTRAVRAYLETIKEELEDQGILPAYLAYAIEYAFTRQPLAEAQIITKNHK